MTVKNCPAWLTTNYLKHLLHYDPLTGIWTWMNPLPRSSVVRGDIAGSVDSNGRRKIRISSGYFYSSRLAFLYMEGKWPADQIDHINRVRNDDRWENLREASQSQNSFNRDWCEESGQFRGIRPHGNKFSVSIGCHYLGLFPTLEEAIKARNTELEDQAGKFAVIPLERKIS